MTRAGKLGVVCALALSSWALVLGAADVVIHVI